MTGSPAIGIDLGGTKIRAALLAEDGSPLHVRHEGTRKDGPPKILIAQLADIIRELQSQCPERAAIPVGIGVAGQIDAASGAITFAPNLSGWREVPLGRLLAEALGRAVFVTNDVRAAAAGEWNFGAGRGCADVVVLFVGTGIGGAVISGGRILTGHRNSAGELGHTTVQLDGPPCHCLNRGCLEALAGGWAIARRARELALASPRDGALLLSLVDGDPERLSAQAAAEAFRRGDPLAQRIIGEAVAALVGGCTSFVNAFNPRRLILGGGVIEGCPELIGLVAEGVRQRALPAAAGDLEIVKAHLGADAGPVGAAHLARDADSAAHR